MTAKPKTTKKPTPKAAPAAKATKRPAAKPAKAKRETQTEKLVRMLRRGGGVPMDDLVADLKIQPHTIRAMISTRRTKHGMKVVLKDGRYRAVID